MKGTPPVRGTERQASKRGRIWRTFPLVVLLAALTLLASFGGANAAPSGLVAAYGFDEGSGTTVADQSGNGLNGTVANTTWATAGKYGKALSFNGTSSRVTIPDAASLHLTTGMTLEAWVDPTTVNSNWRDVIYKGDDNYYLSATSTNSSRPAGGGIIGGSYGEAYGTAALAASSWTYLAVTYDGSNVRLFVNGSQVSSVAKTGAIATSTNPLQIGSDSLYGQYFKGMIDEVRVYNTALTAAQIQTDMTTPISSTTPTYSVGGSVSGLTGTVVLQDNGGGDLSVASSGPFTFATKLASGAAYAVTVRTNPAGQTCTVSNGSGTIGSANVTNVAVTCTTTPTYSVGGSVSGLTGTVVLQDNGGDDLSVASSGPFTFATKLASGAAYAVTVRTNPAGQTCTVSNGSGTIGSANVTNVAVTCTTTPTYSVGGSVSGLTGTVVLQDNGGDDLSVASSGPFTFATKLASGAAYAVTVRTNPAGQTCTVSNGSGTIGSANVTNVAVTCTTTPTYSVGGSVSGLTGTVVLQDNGGDDLSVASSGPFTFATKLASGAAYAVTVRTNPAGQTCTVSNGSGTIGSANVTNVAVTCTTTPTYSVGGSVSGLTGTVVLQDNGGDDLSVASSGPFTFATKLASGAAYAVTVRTNPAGQTCTVSNGSGTIGSANVTNVAVTCTTNTGPSGLVAAYGFDAGSGTTVTDQSGNGNNGTITNATWATTGKYGGALQFNGTNARVDIPNAASLDFTTGMTLEAWVDPSTVNSNWRDVIYKGNDNYYLSATSTNASKPDAGLIGGGTYADAYGSSALTANGWTYLTETYDGANVRLYVNGTLAATTAHTGAISTSTNPLQIGGDSIYGQYFTGMIDEVRLYNTSLTAAQIQTDMTTPISSTTPTYSVGGSVSGLTGTVVLQDNGGDDLSVASSGPFTFATKLASGAAYAVTVRTNPAGQTCTVSNGSGTIGSANITNVAVTCTTVPLGPPSKLAFVQGPSDTAVGAAMTPAVRVAVEDANGNVETSDNATKVSLAIATNPAGGTLSGGSAVTVASGIATFSGLSIDTAGSGYTLTASSTPSYSATTSTAFNITAGTPPGWTTYLQGNDRTEFASGESGFNPTSVTNLQLAWEASDAGPSHGVFAQPIVSNGLVYWGSFDGYERATDTSGNLVWQTNLGTTAPKGCTPTEVGVVSTPTVTTDVPVGGATSVMYVGGGNSKLYALNAATGAVLWSYDVGGNPSTFIYSSPAVFGNSVYIGVASFGDCPLVQGRVLQINRVTGALQNTYDVVPNGCTGGGVWSSPTLDAVAGTIYITTGTPSPDCPGTPGGPDLIELRASDLSLVGSWQVPVAQQQGDADFGATPTLFTGVIGGQSVPLVGAINKNGIFYAFRRDAISAGPVWSTRIALGGDDPTVGSGDQASGAFDGTTLYVGGDKTSTCSGTVNALNPSTGAFIWQHCFTDGGWVMGGVTVTSGGVVAVGEGNNISLVSAASGASLFTYSGAGAFWGPPSVAGGTLYEGDMSGNLYALTSGAQAPGAQFVQVNSATPQTSQTTVSVPYVQGQNAGDLNVVVVGLNNATSTITSVTDSAGNVYQVAAPLTRGSAISQAIYYASNIKSATGGSNVVTVQFSGAVPYPDVRVLEYSGLDPANPLDTSASAAGTGANASSGNLTTSAAREMIFGAGTTTGGFSGGTNGLVSRIITPTDGDIAGDKSVSAVGSYAATANQTGGASASWVMQGVAFRDK